MKTITHELLLAADNNTVFQAVATGDGIRAWWAKDADTGASVGDLHTLRFQKGDRTVTMVFRIDALDEERVAWTCTENGNPAWTGSTLVWALSPEGSGTRVTFQHAGFAMGGPPYDMTVQGWVPFINSLKQYCESGSGQPM